MTTSTAGAPLTEAEVLRVRAWVGSQARNELFLPLVAAALSVSSWFSTPPGPTVALWAGAVALLISGSVLFYWTRRRAKAAGLRAGDATELVSGPFVHKRGRTGVGPLFAGRLISSVALEAGPPEGGWGEARALTIDHPGSPGMGRWLVVQWLKTSSP